MRVINNRKLVIDLSISIMVDSAWKSRLGNILIEKGELRLSADSLLKLRGKMNKSLYIINTKIGIFVPMGSLLSRSLEIKNPKNFYFLLVNSTNLEVILSKLSDFYSFKESVISESRARNAIVYWLRDWQLNSDLIEEDLLKIKEKIQKEG